MCGSGFSLLLLLRLGITSFFIFLAIVCLPLPLEDDALLKDDQGSGFADFSTALPFSILKQIDKN